MNKERSSIISMYECYGKESNSNKGMSIHVLGIYPSPPSCLCLQSLILFHSLPTLDFIQEEQLPHLVGFKSKKVRSLLTRSL